MTLIQRIDSKGCGCDSHDGISSLVSIYDALLRIAKNVRPIIDTETVPLARAAGRVLSEPIRSKAMTPPFDNSAMDGYAVNSRDFTGEGPWTFPVSDRVPAGVAPVQNLDGRAAARIFTGAPIPCGADAVVKQEDVSRIAQEVTFKTSPEPGQNIRRAGGDLRSGQLVLKSGTRLGPRDIAASAAAGVATVPVRRALRVGLLVTGNEIRDTGSRRTSAEIWDVNTPMLVAALNGLQVNVVQIQHVADCRETLEASLTQMVGEVDLIVTSGGVSVGEEDHVKPVIEKLDTEIFFSGVAIKPGKPVSCGRIGKAFWLGLPGNPLSAFVTWQVFGTALVEQLTGQTSGRALRRHVVTSEAIHRKPGRCELRLATFVGFDNQGRETVGFESAVHSGRVGQLPEADGLIFLPADSDCLPSGALVEFFPFNDR